MNLNKKLLKNGLQETGIIQLISKGKEGAKAQIKASKAWQQKMRTKNNILNVSNLICALNSISKVCFIAVKCQVICVNFITAKKVTHISIDMYNVHTTLHTCALEACVKILFGKK